MIATIASGQKVTMREVLGSAPDSIFPYLTKNNRLDMIDFCESNMKAVVDNELGGKSQLDTLTSDYLHLTLNETTTVEMKLLESSRLLDDTTKTIVCMSTTYADRQSDVEFYSSKWHKLSIPLTYDRDSLIVRPDSMSAESYADLLRMAGDLCVVAKLSPSTTDIALSPSFLNVSEEDRSKLEAAKRKIILNFEVNRLKYLNNSYFIGK